MKKKLVFYIYLIEEQNRTAFQNEIYELHYRCLQWAAPIFDEMLFVLSLDDVSNYKLIREWEEKLTALHSKGIISFEIHKNDIFRESYAFKKHVVDNIGENALVFFGHAKGLSNEKYHNENIYRWAAAMYYYNFAFMDEVEDALINTKSLSYGSFLTKNDENEENMYKWFYIGCFFWINSGKIRDYIRNNNIDFPLYSDRFYDEEFLGNLYDMWPMPYAFSHETKFIVNAENYYKEFEDYLTAIYEDHKDFDDFYYKIKNEIKL